MIEARFHPLDLATWPGPFSVRKAPQFRSTWGQTLDFLETELRTMRAREIVIQAAFSARDIRNDGWPRGDARTPSFPGVIVSFESKVGPLTYATDVYTDGSWYQSGHGSRPIPGWQANVRAIALSLEALRAVDRHGVTRRGEQYAGFGALPPASFALGAAMTVEEAAAVLGLSGGSWSDDEVRDAYRARAKETHPDQGGDPEEFKRVTEAKGVLERNLR